MQLGVCEDTLRISRTSLPQWVQSRALEGCEQVCRSGRDYWLYIDKLGFYYLSEICISIHFTNLLFTLLTIISMWYSSWMCFYICYKCQIEIFSISKYFVNILNMRAYFSILQFLSADMLHMKSCDRNWLGKKFC